MTYSKQTIVRVVRDPGAYVRDGRNIYADRGIQHLRSSPLRVAPSPDNARTEIPGMIPVSRSEARDRPRYSAEDGVRVLNLALLEALEETAPVEISDRDVLLAGGGLAARIGTDSWLEEARSRGSYFPLPHGFVSLFERTGDLRKEDDFLKSYRDRIAQGGSVFPSDMLGQNGRADHYLSSDGRVKKLRNGAVNIVTAFSNLAHQLVRLNEYFARLDANGATDAQLKELARRIVRPDGLIKEGGEVDDAFGGGDLMQAIGRGEETFGSIYYLLTHNTNKIMEKFNELDGELSGYAGELLGQAGIDLLVEASDELALELFKDSEQYKTDINLAILETVRSIAGDMLGWTRAERLIFDQYINDLRNQAIGFREETLDTLRKKYPSPRDTA